MTFFLILTFYHRLRLYTKRILASHVRRVRGRGRRGSSLSRGGRRPGWRGGAHYEVLMPLSSCLMAVGQGARAAQARQGPACPSALCGALSPCPGSMHGQVLTGACPSLSPEGPTQAPTHAPDIRGAG